MAHYNRDYGIGEGEQVKMNMMGCACSTYGRDEKC
jgi:hypothetical protein